MAAIGQEFESEVTAAEEMLDGVAKKTTNTNTKVILPTVT